jgi:hypothetical protein
MAGKLSEFTRKLAEKKLAAFCDSRIPGHLRNEIRLSFKFRGSTVTLFESRPGFRDRNVWSDMPIAQFRFDDKTALWTLYCADRNDRWHLYFDADPTADLDVLLAELDADPTGIFWG